MLRCSAFCAARPHSEADTPRQVVSEPIGDLPGAWIEVPEASVGVVGEGRDDFSPFAPLPPV